ncbi:hypothetical protein [Robiginitalea sp. SC105]|uniref:hypothetical protein n=1 Tax=Robiginitalea sp. SC105 TaxID=2762332 RepID=UPI00163952E9|nr:hypothetical protein [Robiginitalea sp. SC105]MBC2838868.1 hypothetical protein [Robiginitalea sp. SC105]
MERKLSIIICLIFFSCGEIDGNHGDNARVMVWQFVKDNLRDPGSADFGLCEMTKTSDNGWETDCYVDAKNGFGGTERLYFYCKVRLVKESAWELEKLTFK